MIGSDERLTKPFRQEFLVVLKFQKSGFLESKALALDLPKTIWTPSTGKMSRAKNLIIELK